MPFNEGWFYKPDYIAASLERMAADGLLVAGDGASFRGEWRKAVADGDTAFLACTVEPEKVPAYCQSTGVCTSMIFRALQDCFNWDRVKFGSINRAVSLCFETLFAGSRIAIGRGQLGNSDGSVGSWIAEYVARFGVIERGNYQGVDLLRPREDLAQFWGRPGVGVPAAIQNAGAHHRFKAHKCESVDELADALSCGFFGGICRSHYAHSLDSERFATFGNMGGHHTCIRGVFIDRRSERRVFVEQQSHGPKIPDPYPVAHTTDGDVELSDGAYLVREEDIVRFISSGEMFVFQPIQGEEFR